MTKDERRELRVILLGQTLLLDDGRLSSQTRDEFLLPNGVGDGAGAVRILGLAHREIQLESDFDEEQTLALARRKMLDLGRALYLRTQPEAAACLIRHVVLRPVVLTVRYVDGAPVLTAWTGRSLSGIFALRRALNAFIRELPEGLRLSMAEPPVDATTVEKKKRKKKQKQTKDEPAPTGEAAVTEGSKEEEQA